MENLTLPELFAVGIGILLALSGAINTVGSAVEKIAKARAPAKAPNAAQDERLNTLERDGEKIMGLLDKDKRHLDALDEGNRVTQEALFALLAHAIDGNNINELKKAQDALHSYLIYGKTSSKAKF